MAALTQTLVNSPLVRPAAAGVRWWVHELSQVGAALTKHLPDRAARTPAILLPRDADTAGATTAENARYKATLDKTSFAELAKKLAADGRTAEPVTLRIDDRLCLTKRSAYPDVSDAELSRIIDLEVAATTPFKAENAVWTWRHSKDGVRHHVETIIAKTGLIEDVEALAAGAGIRLAEIAPNCAPSEVAKPFRSFDTPRARAKRLWRKVNIALVLGLLLGTAGIYAAIWAEKTAALESLQSEIAEKTQTARDLRSDATRRENLAREARKLSALKTPETSVVEAWARITKLLPAPAWLTELNLSREGGRIVGFTGNAATLISLLDKDAAFEEVSFATPVRIDPLSKAERFDIRFRHEVAR